MALAFAVSGMCSEESVKVDVDKIDGMFRKEDEILRERCKVWLNKMKASELPGGHSPRAV